MQEKVAAPQAAEQIQASVTEFMNLHEFVAKARQNLSQNHWDYIVGAAETETTLRRNRMALDSIAFRPRVLTRRQQGRCVGRALRPQAAPAGDAGAGRLARAFHPGGGGARSCAPPARSASRT